MAGHDTGSERLRRRFDVPAQPRSRPSCPAGPETLMWPVPSCTDEVDAPHAYPGAARVMSST
jgi:hypothetical protein